MKFISLQIFTRADALIWPDCLLKRHPNLIFTLFAKIILCIVLEEEKGLKFGEF